MNLNTLATYWFTLQQHNSTLPLTEEQDEQQVWWSPLNSVYPPPNSINTIDLSCKHGYGHGYEHGLQMHT